MAADNAARRPRENSSEGTLATRRSRARNSLAPTSLPTPLCAGPPGSRCARRREQPVPTPNPASRNAFTARVPMHGWRWPVGTAQHVPASVSQDRGGPHPSSHLTRPYWMSLAPQPPWGAGYTNVSQWARIGGRTCVPRSLQRWVAGSGKALSPVRSRSEVGPGVGPGFVRTGDRGRSWVGPKWVAG